METGKMSTGANRILDDLARLMTDAAGAAQGVRREVEAAFRRKPKLVEFARCREARGVRGGQGNGRAGTGRKRRSPCSHRSAGSTFGRDRPGGRRHHDGQVKEPASRRPSVVVDHRTACLCGSHGGGCGAGPNRPPRRRPTHFTSLASRLTKTEKFSTCGHWQKTFIAESFKQPR